MLKCLLTPLRLTRKEEVFLVRIQLRSFETFTPLTILETNILSISGEPEKSKLNKTRDYREKEEHIRMFVCHKQRYKEMQAFNVGLVVCGQICTTKVGGTSAHVVSFKIASLFAFIIESVLSTIVHPRHQLL